jgi:hypothetical protein
MKNRKRWFWFFRCNGSTFKFKCLDRGVAVGIGLAIELKSLPLARVAIGKFNRGVDQSGSGPGAFLLLKLACFDLILLWGLSG